MFGFLLVVLYLSHGWHAATTMHLCFAPFPLLRQPCLDMTWSFWMEQFSLQPKPSGVIPYKNYPWQTGRLPPRMRLLAQEGRLMCLRWKYPKDGMDGFELYPDPWWLMFAVCNWSIVVYLAKPPTKSLMFLRNLEDTRLTVRHSPRSLNWVTWSWLQLARSSLVAGLQWSLGPTVPLMKPAGLPETEDGAEWLQEDPWKKCEVGALSSDKNA